MKMFMMLTLLLSVSCAKGCPVQPVQIEACSNACASNGGVKTVTLSECSCIGKNPQPEGVRQ